jgi:hypothetical protein
MGFAFFMETRLAEKSLCRETCEAETRGGQLLFFFSPHASFTIQEGLA